MIGGRSKSAWVWALGLVCALGVGGSRMSQADADERIVIRYATLAPSGSTFGKILKAWSRSLLKETDGRVELRYYSGGSQGDERDFIRKMRAGQMDAAGITATGLGIIVRPVLVLSSPGLIETYDQLDRVRDKLTPKFQEMFREAGFELLAWADAGQGRIMSTKPILRPSDLRSARPWVWKDDPIFAEFLKVVGANGVRLGVPEVYGALQTKMVDVVPNSCHRRRGAAVVHEAQVHVEGLVRHHHGRVGDQEGEVRPAHSVRTRRPSKIRRRVQPKPSIGSFARDDAKAYQGAPRARHAARRQLSRISKSGKRPASETRERLTGSESSARVCLRKPKRRREGE